MIERLPWETSDLLVFGCGCGCTVLALYLKLVARHDHVDFWHIVGEGKVKREWKLMRLSEYRIHRQFMYRKTF